MGKRNNGEGSFTKTKINGKQYFCYKMPPDEDGKRKTLYGKTQKELKEKIEIEKSKIETPLSPKNLFGSSKFTFGELAERWFEHFKEEDVERRTLDAYEVSIKTYITNYRKYDLCNMQVGNVKQENVQEYINSFTDKYSMQTITRIWCAVSKTISYGLDIGVMHDINLDKIVLPKEKNVASKKKEIVPLDMDDLELFYKQATMANSNGNPKYGVNGLVLALIAYSGLRVGETTGLRWVNVADDLSYINVRESAVTVLKRDSDGNTIKGEDGKFMHELIIKPPKTEKGIRTVPLPEKAINILRYIKDNNYNGANESEFVFNTSKGTNVLTANVQTSMNRILKDSECKNKTISPHGLRHTYGSILLKKGVDIKVVSEILGHSKITTTYDIYIGILKEDKIDAVRSVFD